MVVDLRVEGERRVFRKDSGVSVGGRLRNMRRDLVHVSLSHWFVELTFFVIRYMDNLSTLTSNKRQRNLPPPPTGMSAPLQFPRLLIGSKYTKYYVN